MVRVYGRMGKTKSVLKTKTAHMNTKELIAIFLCFVLGIVSITTILNSNSMIAVAIGILLAYFIGIVQTILLYFSEKEKRAKQQ